MATPATISLGGSTVAAPTSAQVWPNPNFTVHSPIDGAAIVQSSAFKNSLGDKNEVKKLIWDGLPTSDSRWSHTIATLKALEGTETTLDMDSLFGSTYLLSTDINVQQVQIEWVGRESTTDYYRVEIGFTDI